MQRLLTVLVLVLLVAVAVLGITVAKLPDAAALRPQPAPVRPSLDREIATSGREAELERKITLLQEQVAALTKELRERPEPLKGAWKDVGPAVEKRLAEQPVVDLEVSQWKPVMVERYGVDISPLMRLVE